MITFPQKYHEAIKAGKITTAFRDWNTLTLQKNKIYKSYSLGLLRVLDVCFKKLSDITIDEVKRCGHKSMHQFRVEYEVNSRRAVDFKTDSAVKIDFEYMGEDIENKKRLMGKVTPLELFEIKQKMLTLEEKSDSPWILKSLQILSKNGALSSKELGKLLKISPEKIKLTMRKLKDLSLIYSDSKKGYSLTPLSFKLFRILNKK
ncbi:MAG: hypothetical protein AB1632_05320 [Nitrospirota bacterium]